MACTTDDDRCIIACLKTKANDRDEATMMQIPHDLKSIKNEMRDQLSPLGLWEEDKFGLWAVQHCSY